MEKMKNARGNHYDSIKSGMYEMKFLGGPDRLQAIRETMETVEPELGPCPFCGGIAIINGTFSYANPAVIVQCADCRCRTPMGLAGVELPTQRHWTLEERVQEAVKLWNRRAAV